MSLKAKSHVRSALKSFTWRVFAGLDTFTLTFFVTHHVGAAVGVVGMEFVTKYVWYYAHERVWTLPIMTKFFS